MYLHTKFQIASCSNGSLVTAAKSGASHSHLTSSYIYHAFISNCEKLKSIMLVMPPMA